MLAPPLSSGDSDGTGSGLTQWCRLRLVGEMTVEAPGGADRGLPHSLVCGLCRRQPPGASLKSPCLRGSRVEGRGSRFCTRLVTPNPRRLLCPQADFPRPALGICGPCKRKQRGPDGRGVALV